MKIRRISAENFRNVAERQSYDLHPSFTALIGINGKGKSTWLHALRIACGSYFLGIPQVESRHIKPEEIRKTNRAMEVYDNTPVVVEATGVFPETGDNEIVWRRRIPKGKLKTTSSQEDVGQIRDLGKAKFDRLSETNALDLPLIAYFGTSRVHGGARNRGENKMREIFIDGYFNWFEMRANAYQYPQWLGSYDVRLKHGGEVAGTKEAFYECIQTANPYIANSDFANGELWVKIKKQAHQSDMLPLQYHSDGIVAVTEMVAELAYRCIALNSYKGRNAIKETQGVVMIDEIDLHLHPSWQKHLATDLKKAFPNLQFVVTTHSPFIIQSLSNDEIINLDEGAPQIKPLNDEPYEHSLEEVSEYVMGVANAHRSAKMQEMKQTAAHFFSLLQNGSPEQIAQAKQQLDQLRVEYATKDPAFLALLELELINKTT